MKTTIAILRAGERLLDVLDLIELAFFQGEVDSNDILPDYSSSADVEMSHFAVSHQTFWKADGEGRGFQFGEALGGFRVRAREFIHDGGVCCGNGIAILGGALDGNTPSVYDNWWSGIESVWFYGQQHV